MRFVKYVFLIILIPTLGGCYKSSKKYIINQERLDDMLVSSPSLLDPDPSMDNTSFSSNTQEPRTSLLKKFAIVLAHGLNMHHEYLQYFRDQFKTRAYDDYGEPVIILLRSSEGNLSLYSIERQAFLAINEINEALKDNPTIPIVLIGHSQGTLRVEKIKELTEKMKNFRHQIVSIISIAGLFEGVPVLNTSVSKFNRFWKRAEKGLRKVCQNADELIYKERFMIRFYLPCARWYYDGINDMRPESKFLKRITSFIQSNPTPRLFIAGSAIDFNLLFGTENDQDVIEFGKAYAELITGKEDGDNDVLVPTDSQLGNNIQNQLIERTVIQKVVHATNLVPLLGLDDFLTPEHMQATGIVEEVRSLEVVEKTYDFIKRHLNS